MKTNNALATMLVTGLLAGGVTGCVTEKQEHANLAAQAKVSRAQAEQTALAKAPGGRIKEGELEKEKGRLIWSFDISTPDTKDITEVAVDACSGAVVSVEKESAADAAREQAAEAKDKKPRKDKADEEKEEK
jgi:hypothetical protein